MKSGHVLSSSMLCRKKTLFWVTCRSFNPWWPDNFFNKPQGSWFSSRSFSNTVFSLDGCLTFQFALNAFYTLVMGSLSCHDVHPPLPIGSWNFNSSFCALFLNFVTIFNRPDIDMIYSIMSLCSLMICITLSAHPPWWNELKRKLYNASQITQHLSHRTNSVQPQKHSKDQPNPHSIHFPKSHSHLLFLLVRCFLHQKKKKTGTMLFLDHIFYLALTLTSATVLAAVNGPCSFGKTGVCLPTAQCSGAGDIISVGFCPNDPNDVKCCSKPSCGLGGYCEWTYACDGITETGLCPGPADFKCCLPIFTTRSGAHSISANGVKFIAGFEGFRKDFYLDAAVSEIILTPHPHPSLPLPRGRFTIDVYLLFHPVLAVSLFVLALKDNGCIYLFS